MVYVMFLPVFCKLFSFKNHFPYDFIIAQKKKSSRFGTKKSTDKVYCYQIVFVFLQP